MTSLLYDRSRRFALVAIAVLTALAVLAPITAAQATGPVNHTELVADQPRTDTPRITSGTIEDMVQWGDRIILGGSFPSVQNDNGQTINQPYLVAYDIDTGLVDTSFTPDFDRSVSAMAVSADGQNLFVVGLFNTVNGVSRRKIVKLNQNGSVVNQFVANTNSRVSAVAVSPDGNTVYVGGFFATVNGVSRGLLAELNANTGAVGPLDLPITGGIGVRGTLKVQDVLLTPDGETMAVVHTGNRVDGLLRQGVAVIDLTTNSVDDWQTDIYEENLPRVGGVQRITSGDISPDGTYFVVVSGSGGDRPPINDTAIAWPVAGGAGVEPIWVSRHFDSLFSVAITEFAVYIGGHFRWQEAPGSTEPWPGDTYTNYGWDAGIGAAALGDEVVRRDQIGALNPATGKALNWNPGSNAAVGVLGLEAVERGLLVAQDNDILGGFDVGYHGFFDWESIPNPDGPQTNITDPFSGLTIDASSFDILGTAFAENGVDFVRVWICQGPCYGQGAAGPFLQDDMVTFAATPNFFNVEPDAPGTNATWGMPGISIPSGNYQIRARTFQVGGGSDGSFASVDFEVDNDGDDPPITDITYPGFRDIPESTTFTIEGTAADDFGVASVRVSVWDRNTDWYLQPDMTLADQFSSFNVPVEPAGGQVVTWGLEVTLPFGDYLASASATDTIGQSDNAFVRTFFSLSEEASANLPPAVTFTTPLPFEVFDADTPLVISGTTTDEDGTVEELSLRITNSQTTYGVTAIGEYGPNPGNVDVVLEGPGNDRTWSYATPPLPPGQYSIRATATDDLGSRGRPSTFAIAAVPGDAQPETTFDQEGRDQDVDSLTLNLSGTATDDNAVDRVAVTIRETRPRAILQGARYVTSAGTYDPLYTEIDAVLSGPATNRTWSLSGVSVPEDGDYTITVKAVDNAGQYDIDQTGATANLLIWPGDTDPYTWIQAPNPGESLPAGSVIINGRAFDDLVPFCSPGFDCGVNRVDLQIRNSAGLYMDGFGGFGTREGWVEAFLTNPTGQFSNWNYATPELPDDTYTVQARVQDLRLQYDEELNPTLIPVGTVFSLDFVEFTVGTGSPTPAPALTLSSSATPATFAAQGETIAESFVLTNTGNVLLDGPFTVDSDQAGDPITCPEVDDLAVGGSVACTASNFITATEFAAEQSVTVAQGHGAHGGSPVDSNQDTLIITIEGDVTPAPALTLSSSATPSTFAAQGESIAEDFVLTNTGNVLLDGPFTVDSDQTNDPITCTAVGTLAVGASVTCTASNFITAAEVTAGQSVTVATGHAVYDGSPVDSNQETLTVSYDPPVAADIQFRASASSSGNQTSRSVTIPGAVEAGDLMLLFISVNNATETVSTPGGWSLLDTQVDGSMQTRVFSRVATGGDAGSGVTVNLGSRKKADMVLVAYSGVDSASPILGYNVAGQAGSSVTHTTPNLATGGDALIVSYWGEKNSSTTSMTTGTGVTRHANSMTGGGAITALLVDGGSTVPAGNHGGVTATADAASGRATMWTIALNPA